MEKFSGETKADNVQRPIQRKLLIISLRRRHAKPSCIEPLRISAQFSVQIPQRHMPAVFIG